MGFFDIFKKHNVERGKEAEDHFRNSEEMWGAEIRRKPVGSDFEKIERDPLTGKITRRERWEVKRNNSPLSERQKKTKGLKVARYKDGIFGPEKTVEDRRGNKLDYDPFTGRYERQKKSEHNMFGESSSSSKRKSSSADPFGMFGGSNTSKKKRKKSDPYGLGW